MAASATIALWNEACVRNVLGRRSAATISTASRPVAVRGLQQATVGGGCPGDARDHGAQRLGDERHRGSGAHGVAVPAAADHGRLRAGELLRGEGAGPDLLRQPPDVGAAAQGAPRKVPVSIGPPGTTTAGRSTEAAAMSSDGMVLSQPPSRTTPSIGLAAEHLLGGHRGHVAPQHRGGPQLGLAQRDHRQLQRDAARLVDAVATDAATSVRWALHGVRSEAVLAMAICGRPVNASPGTPRRIHARWI